MKKVMDARLIKFVQSYDRSRNKKIVTYTVYVDGTVYEYREITTEQENYAVIKCERQKKFLDTQLAEEQFGMNTVDAMREFIEMFKNKIDVMPVTKLMRGRKYENL